MKKPFFSIITATKNSGKYIADNLSSINNQTFGNFEHIIIDGFSTDNTMEIIEKYKTKKTQIFQKKPNGISAAFNEGIRVSSGKYLIFLNSDDYFYSKEILSKAAAFISESEYPDWIYGIKMDIESDGTPISTFPKNKLLKISSSFILKLTNFIPHQAVFISKKVFFKYGNFSVNFPYGMDYDLWLRICNKTKWIFFDQIVCIYRVHPEARSTSIEAKEKSKKYRNIIRKNHLTFAQRVIVGLTDVVLNQMNKTYR